MRVYFAEMFPLPARIVTAALFYLGFSALLARAHGVALPLVAPATLVGIWSVFAVLLMLRLMDELKDADLDRLRHPERPLPSGRVLASDLRLSLIAVIVLFVTANMWGTLAFWAALVVLVYALLMGKEFFMQERMRRSPGLLLFTHTPVIPLLFVYLVARFADTVGFGWGDLRLDVAAVLVLLYWLPFFAWELARKVRSPEEGGGDYAPVFGRRGTVAVALGAQTVALGLGLWTAHRLDVSPVFAGLLLVGYAGLLFGYARYLRRPDARTARLKPYAEGFMLAVSVGALAALW